MEEREIATVADLVEFLKENFRLDDRLCFFDEGGAWCEVVHVPKSFIGDKRWMFNYVKDKRKNELESMNCKKEDRERLKKVILDSYKSVDDNGVVIY